MRWLYLEGGGASGADQVGVLKALMESGHKWDRIVGVSAGAVNGHVLSRAGMPYLENMWRSITSWKDVMGRESWWKVWDLRGLYNFNPLAMELGKLAERNPTTPVTPIYVNFQTGDSVYAPDSIPAVLASSALAGVNTPYMGSCFDGGHRKISRHINWILAQGCTRLDVVLTTPRRARVSRWKKWEWFPLLSIMLRALGLLQHDSAMEFQEFEGDPRIHIWAPDEKVEPGGMDYDPKKIGPAIEKGYRRTLEALGQK